MRHLGINTETRGVIVEIPGHDLEALAMIGKALATEGEYPDDVAWAFIRTLAMSLTHDESRTNNRIQIQVKRSYEVVAEAAQ